jgi:hypothetical protein
MTVIAPDPHPSRRPRYMNPSRDAYLRRWHFVSVATLAADLGLPEIWVARYLRLLGLRRCAFKRTGRTEQEAQRARADRPRSLT